MPKIKSKVVRSTIENKDIMEMFHGVLGTGENTPLNLKIVYPKYVAIVDHCDRFMRLLEALRDSPLMGRFPAETGQLAAYISTLREQVDRIFAAPDLKILHPSNIVDLESEPVDYDSVTSAEYETFAQVYEAVKKSNVVNVIIVTCKNLVPHKKSLETRTALKDRFLTKTAGLSFTPLPDLPSLNFKQIYIQDTLSAADRQYILMVLHKMLAISHDVYDSMSSPDIDVGEFSEVIMSSLGDVKKHIPRCDEAFKKIGDSVHLLKGNFDGYYKDFVASNNPTIIMENFVLDVSKETKSSPKVTGQFRTIIGHYRKLAAQQAQNPQMRTLFEQVDKNFQELEKQSQNADEAEESGDSDDGAEEAAEEAAEEVTEEVTAEAARENRRLQKNRHKRKRQRARKAELALEEAMNSPGRPPKNGPEGGGESLADEFARLATEDEPGPPGQPEVLAEPEPGNELSSTVRGGLEAPDES